jgi:hypothetical protein
VPVVIQRIGPRGLARRMTFLFAAAGERKFPAAANTYVSKTRVPIVIQRIGLSQTCPSHGISLSPQLGEEKVTCRRQRPRLENRETLGTQQKYSLLDRLGESC